MFLFKKDNKKKKKEEKKERIKQKQNKTKQETLSFPNRHTKPMNVRTPDQA